VASVLLKRLIPTGRHVCLNIQFCKHEICVFVRTRTRGAVLGIALYLRYVETLYKSLGANTFLEYEIEKSEFKPAENEF
jgi:hypothetical protein